MLYIYAHDEKGWRRFLRFMLDMGLLILVIACWVAIAYAVLECGWRWRVGPGHGA